MCFHFYFSSTFTNFSLFSTPSGSPLSHRSERPPPPFPTEPPRGFFGRKATKNTQQRKPNRLSQHNAHHSGLNRCRASTVSFSIAFGAIAVEMRWWAASPFASRRITARAEIRLGVARVALRMPLDLDLADSLMAQFKQIADQDRGHDFWSEDARRGEQYTCTLQ